MEKIHGFIFEHAQIVQRKTSWNAPLPIQIHMQPSHWLSDKNFFPVFAQNFEIPIFFRG